MEKKIVVAMAALCVSFGALGAAAQNSTQGTATSQPTHWYSPARYNPLKLIRKDSKTASEELAANREEDKKLTAQLQKLLPPHADVKDACSSFKRVDDCVAAIHASHNVGVKFDCLKWDLTAVNPGTSTKSCTAPSKNKPMTLAQAIHILKPGADAKSEARTALRQARENISDARS